MLQRKSTHIKVLGPKIVKMCEVGMCKRSSTRHCGSETEQVKELLKRYRRRKCKIAVGIAPRPKVRPREDATQRDVVTERTYDQSVEEGKSITAEFSSVYKRKVRPLFKYQIIYMNRKRY